jgi:hypothetical protein
MAARSSRELPQLAHPCITIRRAVDAGALTRMTSPQLAHR